MTEQTPAMTGVRGTTVGRPLAMDQPETDGPRIRVVLGKMRIDAHDVGARFIMKKLVDAGMEVIFVRFANVQELVDAALQEDAHVIGLSALTGGHLSVARDLLDALGAAGLDDRVVVIGGVIADTDVETLKGMGVDAVFGPGSKPTTVVDFIRDRVDLDA